MTDDTKVLLVILDGLADRAWSELGDRTPLEAAATPNMDRLAAIGLTGLMHPLGRGIAPGSDAAHMVLFGYRIEDYPGRAVFEAIGDGIDVELGEIVSRTALATVERNGRTLLVTRRFPEIDETDCKRLCKAAGHFRHESVEFTLVHSRRTQGILRIGGAASPDVTDCDPYYDGRLISKVKPLWQSENYHLAARTAAACNEFLRWTHARLSDHPVNARRVRAGLAPVNFVLTKWAGRRRRLARFRELYGFQGISVVSGVVYKGLVSEIGMDLAEVGYLDDPGADLERRLEVAADKLRGDYDFVHVHTKLADQAAHEKNPELKRTVIEALDRGLARVFEADLLAENQLVVLTADHATPSGTDLMHSGDPVPVVLAGRNAFVDDVRAFNERACLGGALGQIYGWELMPVILNLTDRIKYSTARLSPAGGIHVPEATDPLEL